MSSEPILRVTRESLSSGTVARLAAEQRKNGTFIATQDDLLASRRAVVPDDHDCSDLWVFGYGSLIFNPVLDFSEKGIAQIYGNHRRFCLRTRLGRGSPEQPGLVLALDQGGSCRGVAFRLKPENAIDELDLLWQREMISLSYRPRWVKLHMGSGFRKAITFVSNPRHPSYAPPMPMSREAEIIATARGLIGPCHDYLFDTLDGLHSHGIRDPHLEKLASAVKARLAL